MTSDPLQRYPFRLFGWKPGLPVGPSAGPGLWLRRNLLAAGVVAAVLSIFGMSGCRNSHLGDSIPPLGSALQAPSNLVASALSGTPQVSLSWTDNSTDEEGFRIQRKIGSNGAYDTAATVPAEATDYRDTGLSPGTTYYYRVQSYAGQWESEWSNEAYTTTDSAGIGYTLQGTWRSVRPDDGFASAETLPMSSSAPLPLKGHPQKRVDPPAASMPEQIIVKFRDEAGNAPDRPEKGTRSGVELRTIDGPGFRLSVIRPVPGSGMTLENLVREYRNRPEVEYAEIDQPMAAYGPVSVYTLPNDPYFSRQWNFLQLGVPDAWDLVTGSDGVTVGVIDTGVAYDLEDFGGTIFVPGRDTVNEDDDPYDDNGHGTHVAATIAESTHNGVGVAGMAYGVRIMPVKALRHDGSGTTSDVVEGIVWAADNGANVINLSLGGPESQSLYDACRYAYQHGVVFCAAAGNNNEPVRYPAAYDEFVLAVGATDFMKNRMYYSNYGPSLDVVAPGGDLGFDRNQDGFLDGILQQSIRGYQRDTGSTDYTPGYYLMQGTSMACAHVSALAALLKSQNPGLSPAEVFSAITNTAEDRSTSGRDDYYGYGLIDPVYALSLQAPTYPVSDSVFGIVAASAGSSDNWRISVARGSTIEIVMDYPHSEGNLNLYLYDRTGQRVADSTGLTGRETLTYAAPLGGSYLVGVKYVP